MSKHFTKEQLDEIGRYFDISPKTDTANVRDGVIKKGDTVWWRAFGGPERIDSADDAHWRNILNHPHAYQISKPEFIGNYLD